MALSLLCCNDALYYVGVATDPGDSFGEHNAGQESNFTKKRKADKLVYAERYETYSNALNREPQLKGCRRQKKEWVINGSPATRTTDSAPSL